jgi:hypothetical protein
LRDRRDRWRHNAGVGSLAKKLVSLEMVEMTVSVRDDERAPWPRGEDSITTSRIGIGRPSLGLAPLSSSSDVSRPMSK